MAVKKLVVNGTTYHLPLEDRYRRHTESERDDMAKRAEQRMAEDKPPIARPVIVYYDKTLQLPNCVLDGQGRLETAARLKLPKKQIPVERHGKGLTTEEAYQESLTHNDARRHDDAGAVARRREEERQARIEEVAKAKEEGLSNRAVAEKLGIDERQVRRDLEVAGDNGADTVRTNGKVVGRDQKVHSSAPSSERWREKPVDKVLKGAASHVLRATRHAGVKTAGQLFDQLEKGNKFGLTATEVGALYIAVNKTRPEAGQTKSKKQGAVKGYDWRELERALATVAKAPGQIARLHPDEAGGRDCKELTSLGTELGRVVKRLRDRLKKK